MPSLAMVFDILAVDRASGVFDKVGGRAAAAGREVEASSGRMSSAMAGIAKGSALAGAAFAVVSTKMAADFQTSVTKLATTAGESTKNLKMVGQGMLDMAGQVGVSANELAKGMYMVESSGIHGADALKVLKAAAQGAKQEQADLSHVTDAVTTSLHDYHLPASMAATVTSQLISAVSHGKTTFDELTGAMHSVEPIAAAVGMNIAQTAGALAAMTASGMHADQAAQNLASSIRSLSKPTQPMINEMAQLGINASDLAAHLGERGVAGSLQIVSEAILKHMGPSGRVLLDTMNQSTIHAQDAAVMFAKLPPQLQALATEYKNGSISVGDYRKALKDLPADQLNLISNWRTMQDRAHGFSSILKTGSPDVQTYIGALGKAVGTSEGLSVALQLTGENAGATNKTILEVGKAVGDTSGNIRGWAEVQGNLNQQLDQAGAKVGSMAIEFGQHLLPVVTATFGYINRDVLPGIEKLGGGIGDAVKWFGRLPGPIKAVAEAMAGMALANSIGLFARLGSGITAVASAMSALTAKIAAEGGLSALRSGLGGILGMLGGPWVVGIAAAVGVAIEFNNALGASRRRVDDYATALFNLKKQQDLGGQGSVDATKKLDDYQKKVDEAQKALDAATSASHSFGDAGYAASVGTSYVSQHVDELRAALTKAKDEMSTYRAGLSPVETAQITLTRAQNDLNYALAHNPIASAAVAHAAGALHDAQNNLATATTAANDAAKTQIQRQQEQATAILGNLDAQRQAQLAQLDLADAVAQYNADVKSGTVSASDLKREQLNLAGSAEQAAKAAADAAVTQAKQNGATETGYASQTAFKDALQRAADKMNGPAKQAILDMIKSMGGNASAADHAAARMENLGVKVDGLPDKHTILIDIPTDDQLKKLHDLGYVTLTLPNGKVIVSADTNPAQREIQDMIAGYRSQVINLRANMPQVPGVQRLGTYATGGYTGDGGKYTPAGIVHAGEFVFPQEAVSKLGVGFLGQLAGLPGYASGGYAPNGTMPVGKINPVVHMDTGPIAAQFASMIAALKATFATPAGSGVERWRPMVDQVLRMLHQPTSYDNGVLAMIQAESGGNPRAINLTDSNAAAGYPSQGLMQTIPSTFAAYAGPYAGRGITDGFANIYAGVNYALHRYGPGILAAGGRHSAAGHYVGYEKGTNFVPNDGPAYLHRGEAVVPAALNKGGGITVYAQFGSETIEATAVRVVDDALGTAHDFVHNATGH